jgi:hypothetical protein
MLYAAGAVWGEQQLQSLSSVWARTIRTLAWAALALDVCVTAAFFLPVAPIHSAWGRMAFKAQGDYGEELGWPELTSEVARIRDSLPETDRGRVGVLAANYGEAGALMLYGPKYGLPRPMSGINSFWAKGYGNPPPETLIVVGFSHRFLDLNFKACELAGHTPNPYGIENEETRDHPDIYVCRGLIQTWPDFWSDFQYYG